MIFTVLVIFAALCYLVGFWKLSAAALDRTRFWLAVIGIGLAVIVLFGRFVPAIQQKAEWLLK